MAKNANSNEFFKDGILHNIEQDHQLLQPKSNLNRNPLWICCPKSVGLLNIIASQVSLIDYMVTSVAKLYKYKNAMKSAGNFPYEYLFVVRWCLRKMRR